MFRRYSIVSTLSLFLSISGDAFSQGTIVTGNIIFSQPGGAPPGTYLQSTAYPGDSGGFFVLSLATIGTGQYRLGYYGIAESYSVHAATQSLSLTPTYVLNDSPLLSNGVNGPSQYDFSLGVGQSMLFGYWDNALYLPGSNLPGAPGNPAPDIYDAYGWFRLSRTVSGIVIADSAVAFGNGIIAGTYNAVPEPGSAAVLIAGALMLGLGGYRRRRLLFARD